VINVPKVTDEQLIDEIKRIGYKKQGVQVRLAELLGLSQPTVSQRINRLIDLGIIDQDWHPIVQDRIAKPTPMPPGYENYHEREVRIRKKVTAEIKADVIKKIEKLLFDD
jgi:DNA-binding transcriptional regulator LsrR (DeoR family)